MTAECHKVLVVGPAESLGGIAAVIRAHRSMRLWQRAECRLLSTYDERNSLSKIASMLKAYVRAIGEIHRASLIHIHLAAERSMIRKLPIVVLTKLMRKPYIVHLHAASERSVFVLTPQWVVRMIFLLSYRVVVLSEYWERVVKTHLPDARVTVIYNPVTPSQLEPEPEPAGLVLFAGKLERRKGYIDLLRAAAEVLQRYPNLKFCFAGHGELEEAIAEARLLRIDESVSFPGWIEPGQLAEYYRRATIFCLPSYDEGLPMAVIEAMSHALPVLCTPVGGVPDLISDGKDGLFVQPGDVNSITQQLLMLLQSPARAQRIGANAARTIHEKCNPERIEQRLMKLYEEVNAEWIVRRRGIREGEELAVHLS